MKASWKPQARKPRFSSQKPRCARASRIACPNGWSRSDGPTPDAGRRASRRISASSKATASATANTASARVQPAPLISPCAAGTSVNCPSPPTAPATASAQLRRSGATSRLNAP